MKSVILLTITLFLVSAPSPDSKTISEISAGFLSPSSETSLAAAEAAPNKQIDSDSETPVFVKPENEKTKPVN